MTDRNFAGTVSFFQMLVAVFHCHQFRHNMARARACDHLVKWSSAASPTEALAVLQEFIAEAYEHWERDWPESPFSAPDVEAVLNGGLIELTWKSSSTANRWVRCTFEPRSFLGRAEGDTGTGQMSEFIMRNPEGFAVEMDWSQTKLAWPQKAA